MRSFLVHETDLYLIPTGENGKFVAYDSWSEYMTKRREQLLKARRKAGLDTSDAVMDYVSPFEIRAAKPIEGSKGPYRTGLLIIHGLNGAPMQARDVLPTFETAGMLIRAVTLPGHGSCPGDLMEVEADDYLACAKWAVEQFRKEVDELYIMGTSTGGALALLAAAENDPFIKGLILESPLIQIGSKLAFLAPYLEKLGWIDPRLKWVEVHSQRLPQFYTATSVHTAATVYALANKVQKVIEKPISASIFSVTAADDDIVNPFELYKFLFSRTNPKDVALIYSLQPLEVPKTEALIETVWGRTSDFGAEVISYNHIALLVSPFNPVIGRNLRFCGHYKMDDPLRAACLDPNVPVYYGSLTDEHLAKYKPMAWLNYNPGFSKALSMLGKYFARNDSITPGMALTIEQIATASAKGADLRQLLKDTGWADLSKAMLAFQKDGDFGAVQRLDLWAPDDYERSLEHISTLRSFTALETLDLSYNRAITDYSVLKDIPELRELDVSNSGFSDLSLIAPGIETLDISGTPVTDLRPLLKLTKLSRLTACNLDVTDVNLLKDLPSLRSLYISPGVDSEEVDADIYVTNVISTSEADVALQRLLAATSRNVDLASVLRRLATKFSLGEVTQLLLTNAESVSNLSALTQLSGCQKLKLFVDNAKNQADVLDLAYLQAMPDLFEVELTNIKVVGQATQWPNLTHAAMRNAQLSDLSLLGQLEDLVTLDLSNNNITDVKLLGVCENLRDLDLSGNPLSDVRPLLGLKLENLDLSETLVSDAEQLSRLPSSVKIQLERTPLSQGGINQAYYSKGLAAEVATAAQKAFNQLLARRVASGKSWTLLSLAKDLGDLGYLASDVKTLQLLDFEEDFVLQAAAFPNLTQIQIGTAKPYVYSIDLSEASQLPFLKTLLVENMTVEKLSLPPSIEKLALIDGKLTALDALKECRGLRELDISYNPVASLVGLENCLQLEVLTASFCDITDFSLCRTFKQLTVLDMATRVKAATDFLQDCKGLQGLWIRTEDFSVLAPLSDLRSLILYAPELRDFSWLKNEKLTLLLVSGSIPPDLSGLLRLTQLHALILSAGPGQISSVKPDASVLSQLPHLRTLFLHNCAFSDLDSLINIKSLVYLDVEGLEVCSTTRFEEARPDVQISTTLTPIWMARELLASDKDDCHLTVVSSVEGRDPQAMTVSQKDGLIAVTTDGQMGFAAAETVYLGSKKPVFVSAQPLLAMRNLATVMLDQVALSDADFEALQAKGIEVQEKE